MELQPIDESFHHQVPLPQSVVGSSDPAWRERYWISFQDTRGRRTAVTLGLGKYPNQDVAEGFIAVADADRQLNLRLSRSLSLGDDPMVVGPLSVRVLEPLKALALRVAPNPSGITLDATWEAVGEPITEERHLEVQRGRVTHDLIRYVQHGRVRGALGLPSGPVELRPDVWYGERDHSWGIRPMWPRPGDPPGLPPSWKFIMFCPLQFDTFAVHIYLYEAQPGLPVHLSAAIRPLGDGPVPAPVVAVDHDLTWVPDAPAATLRGGRLALTLADGSVREVALTAHPARVLLRGGGYGPGQGQWKGESHLEHEVWDLTDGEVLRRGAGSSADHLVEARCDGETGYGVMEYVVRSGYPRYPEAQRRRRVAPDG